MKALPYCVPDILNLVFATARQVSDDDFIHGKVLEKVLAYLDSRDDLGTEPQALAFDCLQIAHKALGVKDPFEKEKERRNSCVAGFIAALPQMEGSAQEVLGRCLRIALAAGNETGYSNADCAHGLLSCLDSAPAIDDSDKIIGRFKDAARVLLIADKAGEVAADALLARQISAQARVCVAVTSQPVLSKALEADAVQSGFTDFAQVIQPGAGMLGLSLKLCSSEFREEFMAADVVICKGEDNFQTLQGCGREVAHLFSCECPEVAEILKIQPGSCVITLASD